jgi:hypothetical protein
MRGQLSGKGNNAASNVEKARFCTKFLLLENLAKYCIVWIRNGTKTFFPKSEPEPQRIITVPQHCFSLTESIFSMKKFHFLVISIRIRRRNFTDLDSVKMDLSETLAGRVFRIRIADSASILLLCRWGARQKNQNQCGFMLFRIRTLITGTRYMLFVV